MPGKSVKRQTIETAVKEAVSLATGILDGKYLRAFDSKAHGYALVGYTNDEIAELFNVSPSQFDLWMVEHPTLAAAIRRARVDDHVRLVRSAHRAGNGFRAKETKVFNVGGKLKTLDVTKVYPPNIQATMFVLGNRQGSRWKDTKTVQHEGKIDLMAAVSASLPAPGDRAKVIDAEPDDGEDPQ